MVYKFKFDNGFEQTVNVPKDYELQFRRSLDSAVRFVMVPDEMGYNTYYNLNSVIFIEALGGDEF